MTASLKLDFGLSFADLYTRSGLERLDAGFLGALRETDPALAERFTAGRANPGSVSRLDESKLLVDVAPHVEDFVATLFGIAAEATALQARHHDLAPLYTVKRQFVQRKAMNAVKAPEAQAIDGAALERQVDADLGEPFSELVFARAVTRWLADEAGNAPQLERATRYAAWSAHTAEGRRRHRGGVLFRGPCKLDFMRLVPVVTDEWHGVQAHRLGDDHLRRREGFALTDSGTDLVGGLDQANYCIWCHEQGKDSCSTGLRDKKPADGSAAPFKKSPFGITLAGCPLEERISEFHQVRAQGNALGALAMICIDNPMAAATGHRICNDCMKSCIYQKQDPVDIPQSETRILKDVLALPWGFEIYSLLTRWNPLDLRRPLPKPESGRKVLVVGMGPAGFTLAHHLLNDGHTVVAVDGLKIEPLDEAVSGIGLDGSRVPFQPVRDIAALYEALDDRQMAGFGGVAEYGITVRWDKNFLKLIRLLLERRSAFRMIGGVRFGSTLSVDDAVALGFDHIALAAGAGKPTVLDMPNGLARGVRTASDFLMGLQLTGAAKRDSIANLQVRLPIVVIGGGLTAIDTATESLAYYPVQVEKFVARHDALVALQGEQAVRASWTHEDAAIGEEFLRHGRAIRAERAAAAREGRAPRILELLRSWGGSTIAYRKRLVDSPAYTLNHEEVEKALEEGIHFAEGLTPLAVEVDEHGHAHGLKVSMQVNDGDGVWKEAGHEVLPARTILVAAGTQPNTVLAREDKVHFSLDGKYFQACDESGQPVRPERLAKPAEVQVLLAAHDGRPRMSFFGDLHPSFAGNVVKAMASAKQGYPVLSRVLAKSAPANAASASDFIAHIDREFLATVREVRRLTPTIVEVVVHAPLAARKFQPGQFYRLQNFEALAPEVTTPVAGEGALRTRLAMEGLALTGAWVDAERGLVSLIVLEMGGSSDLVAELDPGEPVVVMGPTGHPTEIPAGETVTLVGGGLGNAVLFSIGAAMRRAGSRVLYFAGYKKAIDRYKVAEIEAAADVVVWCCDEAPGFAPDRSQDKTFVGNIVQAMHAYASGKLGEQPIAFTETDRIIAIGSDRMMAAVALARHNVLKPFLKYAHLAIGSINSPMQCMMKEICAQCLQPQHDPATGKVRYVFSCFDQDQPLDLVDFGGLEARLRQNGVQEKLTAAWIAHCLQARQRSAAQAA
jgi:NADPH-dependent glutamate synthase beta subunit-like oxidoreductase/NAD(P)H-flavin reductase